MRMREFVKKSWILAFALMGLAPLPLSGATDYTWTALSGTDLYWETTGNWTSVPAASYPVAGDTATFDNTAPIGTVTATGDNSVGTMTFSNTSIPYFVALGGNTLFLDNNPNPAQITFNGTRPVTITAPIATQEVPAGAGLVISMGGTSSLDQQGIVTAQTADATHNNLDVILTGSASLTMSGDVDLNTPSSGKYSLNISQNSSNPFTISGSINGDSSCKVAVLGSGNVTLSGHSSMAGDVYIGDGSSGGHVKLVDRSSIYPSPFHLDNANSTLEVSNSNPAWIGPLSGVVGSEVILNPADPPGISGSLALVMSSPSDFYGHIKGPGEGQRELDLHPSKTFNFYGNSDPTIEIYFVSDARMKLWDSATIEGPVDLTYNGILEVDAGATAQIGPFSGHSSSQILLNNSAPLLVSSVPSGDYGIFDGQLIGSGGLTIVGPESEFIRSDSSSTMFGTVTVGSPTTAGIFGFNGPGAVGGPVIVENAGSNFWVNNTANSKVGSLTVHAGTAHINGRLSASSVVFDGGAILKGIGTITTPLVSMSGTLAPGNSIGTMTVDGSVVFSGPDSTLAVEFDGSNSDLLSVSQDVTIDSDNSTLRLIPGAHPRKNYKYTCIQTGGDSIHGAFKYVICPLPYTLFPSENLLQFMLLGATSLSSIVSTGNPGQVAFYLDSQTDPSSDLSDVIDELGDLIEEPAALRAALNQLHPAAFSAFSLTQENLAIRSRSLYSERANELFYTSCGCRAPHCYCHGVWLDLLGDYTCEKEYGDQYGYKSRGAYAFVGVDCFTTSRINTGLSFGYARSSIDWSQDGWQGNMDSYSAALYASDCFCGTLVDASLQLTYSDIDANRHIEFEDINRDAKSDHGSWLWSAHLGLSQYYDLCYASLVPFAYLDCVDLHEENFEEHDADSLNLFVGNHRANMVRGELGLRVLDDYCWCGARVIPSLSGSVVQEWRYAGTLFKSWMQGATVGTLEVNGVNPDRTLFSPGAEILLVTGDDALSLTLRYEGEFGERVSENTALVKVSYNY